MAEGHSPLEQFLVKRIVDICIGGDWEHSTPDAPLTCTGYDASFTNASLFMLIAVALITIFLVFSMQGRSLIPTRWQSMAELSYEFIANMIRDNVGSEGKKYFPFIFSLFMFILFCNLIGMIPYTFTVTSHIIVTFALAFVVFIGVTIIGFVRHGTHYLRLFVPSGVPLPLLFLLVPIEVLSYLIRPVSLSVRLFANMTAGHTMLKVFGGFVVTLLGLLGGTAGLVGIGVVGSIAALAFTVALTGLEVGIALLQAYVFTILTCIYLNDAVHMHH
ncbi:MAG TPA: F0F1 ATP synthase subunit A [Verrucomicrobiae bacterium]|nr:F0F1 ATP synthase subunit A [Verrucomicrobiae bacterium]